MTAKNNDDVFHAFTQGHRGIANKITTEIGVSEAFDPSSLKDNSPEIITVTGLWDTGASVSIITPPIVSALKLSPSGKARIAHGGGETLEDTYMVNFVLPNKVGFVGILATEMRNIVVDFQVIIGMDIITQGDFAITNVGGKTIVSFRTPSIETIDYVKVANKITYAGVGRNDLCSCKSGRKFKHCHGKR